LEQLHDWLIAVKMRLVLMSLKNGDEDGNGIVADNLEI
jgi:hypothetical protein